MFWTSSSILNGRIQYGRRISHIFDGFVYLTSIMALYGKNHCMGTQPYSVIITYSRISRDCKENTRHYAAAHYTYNQRMSVCIKRDGDGK